MTDELLELKPKKYLAMINDDKMKGWNKCCDAWEKYLATRPPTLVELDKHNLIPFLTGWGINQASKLGNALYNHFGVPAGLDEEEVTDFYLALNCLPMNEVNYRLAKEFADAFCNRFKAPSAKVASEQELYDLALLKLGRIDGKVTAFIKAILLSQKGEG